VGLFHDFNFKYYFGGSFVFSPAQRAQLEHDMPQWLDSAVPVVSTYYMASELATFYPAAAHRVEVVHLPPPGGTDPIEPSLAHGVVRQLGISPPYLLYPTHMCAHKNAGPLIAALALLRGQGRELSLVLTGAGTDAVRGHAHSVGVRLNVDGGDVIGLGYVSNLQIDSLTQCASVVLSPSLYEAGNGPGLDAWGRGTPVAMSNIPAFLEHVEVLGVRAQVFDPRNPQDIADKISAILDNPERARADVEHSRHALQRLTWDQAARAYLAIFHRAVRTSRSVASG
jgi:glycosyltransferase involved in cell wall biosynthesis